MRHWPDSPRQIAGYLDNRGVRKADELAKKAVSAAHEQSIRLPGGPVAARLVAQTATELLRLAERIAGSDVMPATPY